MFERYTETARKAVFYARYEASHFGCPEIETEHVLLGILRVDNDLALRLLHSPALVDAIRARIEQQPRDRKKISLSTDLPLTQECRRVLAYAAEEAGQVKHQHIGTEHLLLGIFREQSCFGARLLREHGVTLDQLREEVTRPNTEGRPRTVSTEPGAAESYRDLTEAARKGTLGPLIGRERELEQAIQILSRRTRNNPVLIGESGVGRTALVEGLAQQIADGSVPIRLADRQIFSVDATSLIASRRQGRSAEQVEGMFVAFMQSPNPILCVEGLFDLATAGSGWGAVEAMHVLESHLSRGALQCVATGTPSGLQHTIERAELLARHFEVVAVLAPDEKEAIKVLSGLKHRYEEFHGVVIDNAAIEAAVHASGRFLRYRNLPDRALDLLDEAGARAKVRGGGEPPEVVQALKRIRRLVRAMEHAMATHQFDEARRHSDEERKERENLRLLREKQGLQAAAKKTITPEDIEEVIAQRTGAPVAAVRRVLRENEAGDLERITDELAAQAPADCREWIPFLAAYLCHCSDKDAETLAQAIRAAKRST